MMTNDYVSTGRTQVQDSSNAHLDVNHKQINESSIK